VSIAVHTYGLLRAERGEPEVQPFVDGIDAVYAVAERSAGFIWRFNDYENLAPAPVGPAARTLSIWQDVDGLKHFVFKTLHGRFYDRKSEWFLAAREPMMVLWNVSPDTRPTMDEAYKKLETLRSEGPSPQAFDWATAEEYAQ
jgi:hypothetical protein